MSIPYPSEAKIPAWFTPNSNANFCEEDYIITSYIAEFINTLTNLAYVVYGIHGLRRLRKTSNGDADFSLSLPYWGLVFVGICSGAFHGVLTYQAQWADDLSMFAATALVFYRIVTFDKPHAGRVKWGIILLGILIPISIYHCWADEILIHVLTFVALIVAVGYRTHLLIAQKIRNKEQKKKIGRGAWFGTFIGIFGYFLWNIDMHLCSQLTSFKRSIGLPWGFIFELHGWWHILTAVGSYINMALVEYLTFDNDITATQSQNGGLKYAWPAHDLLFGPYVGEKKIQ